MDTDATSKPLLDRLTQSQKRKMGLGLLICGFIFFASYMSASKTTYVTVEFNDASFTKIEDGKRVNEIKLALSSFIDNDGLEVYTIEDHEWLLVTSPEMNYYLSTDLKYVLAGQLIDLAGHTNITKMIDLQQAFLTSSAEATIKDGDLLSHLVPHAKKDFATEQLNGDNAALKKQEEVVTHQKKASNQTTPGASLVQQRMDDGQRLSARELIAATAENPAIAESQANIIESLENKDQVSFQREKREYIEAIKDAQREKMGLPLLSNNKPSNTAQQPLISVQQTPTNTAAPDNALLNSGQIRAKKFGYHPDGTKMNTLEARQEISTFYKRLSKDFTVNYEAEGEKRMSIIVFTDYTCGVCSKLHKDVPDLNEAGITVRYMFFPRALGAGIDDPQAQEVTENMRRAWCSADQQSATDRLYRNGFLPNTDCSTSPEVDRSTDNPVQQHYTIGLLFGITGTPLIITEDGKRISGYRSVSQLIPQLGL